MVAHEAVPIGGHGGELTAQIQELAFDYLRAPVGRVGAPFMPVPLSPALEDSYRPGLRASGAGGAVRNRMGSAGRAIDRSSPVRTWVGPGREHLIENRMTPDCLCVSEEFAVRL